MGIFKVSNTEKAIRLLNGSATSPARRRQPRRQLRARQSYQAPGGAAR